MFDCDTAAALTPQPRDKFAKCVSIKHDPAAHQLSLQDCIISAAGVDPVCQLLSVLPADCGRENVKASLHRQIIALRKRAICRVGSWSLHKQTAPGCQRRASVTCTSEPVNASLLSLLGALVFCPASRVGGRLSISAPTSSHFSPGANLRLSQHPRWPADRLGCWPLMCYLSATTYATPHLKQSVDWGG